MVSISDIQNGSYHWGTEDSHANNTETANDFIKNELPSKMKIIWNLYLKMVSIILQPYSAMVTLLTIKLILNL